MKKILFILGLVMAGNMSFASATATTTVKISAVTMPTIVVDDLDFGDYMIGDPPLNDATGNIALTGEIAKDIRLSVPTVLNLTNSTSNYLGINMSLENGTNKGSVNESIVRLDSAGNGKSILTASMNTIPIIGGHYSGTATVTVDYN